MAQAFKLPDLGEGLTEGEIARWLVGEGDAVAEDQPLVEIQTDKATVDIPSPYAGTVLRIVVPEGETAPVGATLVWIGEPGEVVDGEAGPVAGERGGQSPAGESRGQSPAGTVPVQATPVVRRIAQELGVELQSLAGSGPGGRITEEDVRAAAAANLAAHDLLRKRRHAQRRNHRGGRQHRSDSNTTHACPPEISTRSIGRRVSGNDYSAMLRVRPTEGMKRGSRLMSRRGAQ